MLFLEGMESFLVNVIEVPGRGREVFPAGLKWRESTHSHQYTGLSLCDGQGGTSEDSCRQRRCGLNL